MEMKREMMDEHVETSNHDSTFYVGMARKTNGRPYISIASGKLKSLLMYTYKLKYTYNL